MLDLKRKATDGSKTLRVQRLSATTGVNSTLAQPVVILDHQFIIFSQKIPIAVFCIYPNHAIDKLRLRYHSFGAAPPITSHADVSDVIHLYYL